MELQQGCLYLQVISRFVTFGLLAWLNFTAYAGDVAGGFFSPMLGESLSICLYVLFVAILVPGIKKVRSAGITALTAAGF